MGMVCQLKISPERGSLESLPSGPAPKIRAIPARCPSRLTLTEVPSDRLPSIIAMGNRPMISFALKYENDGSETFVH